LSVRLLLVEDDDWIATALTIGLEREGYEVERVATAAGAVRARQPDLVLLDLCLPDGDGLSLVGQLRFTAAVPIIVVTARGTESDRISGLNLGADDYVVKPFSLNELVARINAVMRRVRSGVFETEPVQRLGTLEIDRRARSVRSSGVSVTCTPKEYAILDRLARAPGAVVTREQLLESVWGPHWYGTTKMIDVHVASLRKKIGTPELIETMRGVGFRLAVGH
jgi:two-component system, OmpR family, response regulator RegX3